MDPRVGILMRDGKQVYYGFKNGMFEGYFERATPEEVVAYLDEKPTPKNPYRVITWSDAHHRPVLRIGFHVSDLAKVLKCHAPASAAGRDPITEYTGIERVAYFYDGKSPVQVHDSFEEEINQGMRGCTVVAVDEKTGRYLYEYTMPNGTSALRRESRRSVSYKSLSPFWRNLIEEQFGWSNLVANPQ